MSTFQLGQFFQESFSDLRIPAHTFRLLAHFCNFLFLTATTQLVLNRFDLLLQEIFALLLVDIFTGTHLNRCLDFSQLDLTV